MRRRGLYDVSRRTTTVAGPVLQYSERLEDPDLLDVARSKSQGHLLAISNRNQIAEMITDVLVRRGDREVVRNVAENKGALFSHAGFSILIRKADRDGILAEKVGQRADIPQVLFRELFLHATQIVQKRLVATAGPETQAKIRRVLAEISNQLGINATPPDYSAAQHVVEKIRREDKLDEAAIVNLASDFAAMNQAYAAFFGETRRFDPRGMQGRRFCLANGAGGRSVTQEGTWHVEPQSTEQSAHFRKALERGGPGRHTPVAKKSIKRPVSKQVTMMSPLALLPTGPYRRRIRPITRPRIHEQLQ